MTSVSLQPNSIGWTLALVLGFPLAMIVLGELILRLERRQAQLVAPLEILRHWVLPSLALFIALVEVLRIPRSEVFARLSETLLWITIIYSALTLLNVVLFTGAQADSWQAKVPQLLRDLGRFVLVCVGAAIVLSTVWGANLGGLLTALGVGSLVIGLALQDSLGNVFSGIALLFEQPIQLGDWIHFDAVRGKVIEINWRSVHILTADEDLMVVPNALLAKGTFTNLSRPTRIRSDRLFFSFACDDPPEKVMQVLLELAQEIEEVVADPPPEIRLYDYGDYAISYGVRLFSSNYESGLRAVQAFKVRIWYASRRHGLTIPLPVQLSAPFASRQIPPEKLQSQQLRMLRRIPGLAGLPTPLLETILERSALLDYAAQERVLGQGASVPGIFLILEGQANLILEGPRGMSRTIGVLSVGEIFGVKASLLSDRTSETTIQAIDHLRVLMIDIETLHATLEQSPRLAQELGELMELRRRAIGHALQQP
jgi:small-conductance mechanosensitive channel